MTGDTVTIACKLPNGIILHVGDGPTRREIKLNGNRFPVHPKTGREMRRFEIAGPATTHETGGFGLTPNVPRDLWEQAVKESSETALFKNGVVFAYGDTASARDCAEDMTHHVQNGMDPIDPDKKLAKGIKAIDPHKPDRDSDDERDD